jgi:hypothetical protein
MTSPEKEWVWFYTPEEEWDAITIANWRKRMSKISPLHATEAEQKLFYRLILGVKWVPLKIKDVVSEKGLGISVRRQKADALPVWARQTAFNIALRVRRIAENNEAGPKGGVVDRAKVAEAKSQRITKHAMERRLERLGASRLHEHFLNDLDKSLGKVNQRKK